MATKRGGGIYDLGMVLCCVAGGLFGVVPLAQRVFGTDQTGLYRKVTAGLDLGGPWAYLVPGGAVVLAVLLIAALDAAKQRRLRA
ncbi:hypothetical protein GCM10009754_67030 [Amycolatopsis minnesotensis]|uniref:Uncharacterized protein n=2 Tax=Amycolatopsis minnesotensis TaxID=337894 RepID=A0ABP5DIF4_9PSEU